jgi:hypothetical protein
VWLELHKSGWLLDIAAILRHRQSRARIDSLSVALPLALDLAGEWCPGASLHDAL